MSYRNSLYNSFLSSRSLVQKGWKALKLKGNSSTEKASNPPSSSKLLEKRGLSAENYIAITKTTRATATRDLADLVKKGALIKTGELRHTRYRLNL